MFQGWNRRRTPYDTIVSFFHACLDSTVYPGLSDRAHNCTRVILWIHICAMCVSEEFAHSFPLPHTTHLVSDGSDLSSLPGMYVMRFTCASALPLGELASPRCSLGHSPWKDPGSPLERRSQPFIGVDHSPRLPC